ncbi:tetratricopeptide repeat protein [Lacinutrix sp. C3R15]|uniref:adenylate/guanylate cyclase domain-containing protein n=1 Tax=Flavobacteriaceae TaxID=49546 RepID=UPI001C086800|nr:MULTISPECIES: adenylate/guanylate cyclase domain-containing protein [Flavobacteriaceae]MBU2939678.1 tetratricopeptide repeat protein [Lacinutrix sp. C3R15]MDO6622993.1 adenylate/guanylate cyclase domain-containing protein [Oceanihabitans sp. 1_MG-2023]
MTNTLTKKRQLACIMFTDIVGYTSLMSKDEGIALKTLDENRIIHRSIIKKYDGEWIKELGDGILAIFSTATDAVSAASEIHIATKNNPNLNIRIGLHLSEIIYENGDIFGDGVNIASRVEPTAPSGGTHITHAVQSNLYNKKGIETKFIGAFKLKNVKEDIKIYQVVVTDAFESSINIQADGFFTNTNDILKKSIAVMPFTNMTNDPDQEYFCEGIAEDILIVLSNIKDLKITGRSSSFRFKNSELSQKEISKILNVNHILEGSVRRSGNRLRINAHLINVQENSQIWAERYDRELTDIFEIQDDIANKISKNLKVTLLENTNKVNPVNMEAYEMLLKGRYYEEKFIQGFDKALTCYSRAIELEPNYAEAYAALANIHFLFTMYLIHSPRNGFSKAQYYADKALSINNEIAAAHFLIGQINFWYHWDFQKAKDHYIKASQASVPFYFTGVAIDPWYHAFAKGDFEAAVNATLTIMETNPLSYFYQFLLGCFYTWGKQAHKARKVLDNLLLAIPNHSDAQRLLAYNSLLENDSKRAVTEARKAADLAHGLGWSQITLSIALAQNGDHEESIAILNNLQSNQEQVNISPLGIGLIYAYLNDFDNAFLYLNKAITYKDSWIIALKYGPEFNPLRSDARFATLLEQINYPK